MKNIKIVLLSILLLMAIVFVPTYAKATTHEVTDESQLKEALQADKNYDVISLKNSIALTSPIEINNKDITIDGNNNSITKGEGWSTSSNNGTLLTAGAGATLTLKNLTLSGSAKYGAQAYNSGHIILDGVTVENNAYGGILSNAGTVEIKDLTLKKNGTKANNGIEIAKATGLEATPKIIMNGHLTSTEPDNVIYIATNNEALKDFDIENTDDSQYKILVQGSKVVITDENNDVLYTSNENPSVTADGETFVPNVVVTIALLEKTVTITLQSGDTLTRKAVEAEIDLEELGLTNYTLTGFYSDAEYTKEFSFEQPITESITIYAKLESNETEPSPTPTPTPEPTPSDNIPKDTTPKTGVEDRLSLAIFVLVVSSIAFALLKRKEI